MNRDIVIKDLPTLLETELSKEEAKKIVKDRTKQIGELLEKLYAQKKYNVLIILQGMDASGKDGAVKNIFKYTPAYVLNTSSFKKPTEIEMAHDFLWRVHSEVPMKGQVKIFNRSHYEDILVQYVKNWIDDRRRAQRMEHINAFEKLIVEENNTILLKFFLSISREQQKEELMERVNEEDKHWKHNDSDWDVRNQWDEYMNAYEYVLNHSIYPWIVTPVDKRFHRDLVVSDIILKTLDSLDLEWPPLESERFNTMNS